MNIINNNVLIDLTTLYNSPNRYYHNLNHIHFCLNQFEEFKENNTVLMKREIQYAIWFHDAIYNVYSKTNEKDSAALFLQYTKQHDLSINEQLVQDLILGTEKHEIIDAYYAEEHKIMNDIDFSILGESWRVYDQYCYQIQNEYKHIPPAILKEARINFLRSLLKRDKIFQTEYFFATKEIDARKNIKMEINNYGQHIEQ